MRTLSLYFRFSGGSISDWSPNEIFETFNVTLPELFELRMTGPYLSVDWDALLIQTDNLDPTRSFFLRHPNIRTLEFDRNSEPGSSISPNTLSTLFPCLQRFFGPDRICAAVVQSHMSQLESLCILDAIDGKEPTQVVDAVERLPRLRELGFPAHIESNNYFTAFVDIQGLGKIVSAAPLLERLTISTSAFLLRLSVSGVSLLVAANAHTYLD